MKFTLFICGRQPPVTYPTVRVVRGFEEKWLALGWELAAQPTKPGPVTLEWRKDVEPVKPARGSK